MAPFAYSEDGYELTFATNCLGHFLLVELLTSRIAENGRIVFTASGTHDPDTFDGRMVGAVVEPDANRLVAVGRDGAAPLSAGKRYSTSKLCNILNAYELDRRLRKSGKLHCLDRVRSGGGHGLGISARHASAGAMAGQDCFLQMGQRAPRTTMGSLAFSGASLARLAADPAYADASGKYFQSNDGKLSETRSSILSYDEARAASLWNQMRRWPGRTGRRAAIETTTGRKLIEVATALLDSGGENAVTLRAVGQAAGLSHNAPYKHFASRNALLAAVATTSLAELAEAARTIRTSSRPPLGKMSDAIALFIDYSRQRGRPAIGYCSTIPTLPPPAAS